MKAYTDIKQSEKLSEILPIESADMYYQYVLPKSDKIKHIPEIGNPQLALEWYNKGYTHFGKEPLSLKEYCIPCWSLTALLGLMPFINEYNIEYRPIIEHYGDGGWACKYYNEETRNTNDVYIRRYGKTPLDAAFEMIGWLKENNKL